MKDIYEAHGISRIHSDWASLAGQSYCLSDSAFKSEALCYARQIMARARSHILRIIDELDKLEYRWLDGERVYSKPEKYAQDWLDELTQAGIFLPISLQAWVLEVGNVNMMGSLPSWPKAGYFFEDGKAGQEVVYTDPLVVEMETDLVDFMREEWSADEDRGPFMVDIAPDHIHKANISGGLPYMVAADRARIDSILYNERHCTTFTGYIRLALYWRGFPGFDYIRGDEADRFNWSPDHGAIV